MIVYMVELAFADPAREAAWEAWYDGHVRKLLEMPGFLSAQRFRSTAPTASPYLAIYELASRDVLTSDAYRKGGGPRSPGEWIALMTNWHRNLFDGEGPLPAVARDETIVVTDRVAADDPPIPAGAAALRCIGLDGTVIERGIAIERGRGARAGGMAGVAGAEASLHTRSYVPLMEQARATRR